MDSTSMTPADFSAMMGNQNNGFAGNGAWWIIILFLFLMGGNGFGWNRNGELNQYATAASQNEILMGQKFDALGTKINQVGDGLCSSTYALNNTINGVQTVLGGAINSEGRALQSQLAECCCNNRLATANLGAQMDQQTAAITQAIHAEGEATRNLIQTNEIQTLRDKIGALEADNRMAGVVRYPMSYAYSAGQSPFCGCGCNNAV